MGHSKRLTASDLEDTLSNQAHNHDFFQLVERLYQYNDVKVEHLEDTRPENELIRFESNPSLGFPASDVVSAYTDAPVLDDRKSYGVEVSFLGMHGSTSPLPQFFLEEVSLETQTDEPIKRNFLDFFNHRFITLLHRIWRKYRYYIRFLPDASDKVSQSVFSLVGLADVEMREKALAEEADTKQLPWSRLLTFAGMVATRSRSPEMVSGIVAHTFDLEEAEIIEWEQRYVEIPRDQQMVLGVRNCILGEEAILGEKMTSRNTKFTISIPNLTEKRFRDFLPNGKDFASFKKLIEFLLRDQLAYDVKLGIKKEEIPPLVLHERDGANLGWTTFLGNMELLKQQQVRITVRQ